MKGAPALFVIFIYLFFYLFACEVVHEKVVHLKAKLGNQCGELYSAIDNIMYNIYTG